MPAYPARKYTGDTTMTKHWTIFEGKPNYVDKTKLRVTLNARKVLLFNRAAYEALGSPAAVEMRFDESTRAIGLLPRDPRHANAFPIKRRMSKPNSKYNYLLIHAAPFCGHFEIAPQRTMLFTNVDMDDDGVMMLELSSAVAVGRGSR
jgi:hypothetical protein